MSAEQYLVIGITSLAAAVVALYFHLRQERKVHNKEMKEITQQHSEEQKENIEKMTIAMTNNTNAINNNTKVVDMIFHEINKLREQ